MLLKRLVDTSTSAWLRPAAARRSCWRSCCGSSSARTAIWQRIPAGLMPRGRIGIGPAALKQCEVTPAERGTLTVSDLDDGLSQIGAVAGRGAAARRSERLAALLQQATAGEQDFICKLLLGELRQGALDAVITDAVAKAAGLQRTTVRRALMLGGDLGVVASVALTQGAEGLERFSLQLFRPLQPMLAQPADNIDAVLGHGGAVAVEYKLDGVRVQIHREDNEVLVFTRQLQRRYTQCAGAH